MAKFINLNGKRLLTAQVAAINEMEIDDIIEPTVELDELLACDNQLTSDEYIDKAKQIVERFEIKNGDIIHVNGIEFNLVNALNKISESIKFKCVYSQIDKIKIDAADFKSYHKIVFKKFIYIV